MRENDGRHLSRRTLEELRLRTVRQIIEDGLHPDDAAAALGLSRSTVYGWLARYRTGGWDALKERKAPGASPKLTAAEQRELGRLIAHKDPRQLELDFGLWTRERVREVIRSRFGVKMHVTAVGRLLLYQTWTTVVFAVFAPLVLFRARREEQALAAEFGEEWQAYIARTKFIIPFAY